MARRRILVTGVARWWGALVVQRLVEARDVDEVIGIDTQEPSYDLGPAGFLKLDIRYTLVGKLVRAVGIDTVVHTQTTIDSFDLDRRQAHETNVIGTLNLLAGCSGADSPVRRVVLKSSAHVYGTGPDVPSAVTEDRRLEHDSPHPFVRDMAEVESYVFDFALRNPDTQATVLRFCNALSPTEPAPLARYLDLDLVPTVLGADPALQLVHQDDCVRALATAALGDASGAFNIAGEHPLPLGALLDRTGKLHAPLLPPRGLGLAAQMLRRLGVAFLSPQLLDLLREGRTVSTAKARRQLKFKAERDTTAALEDFVQQRRVIRFMPADHSYTYEKELEDFIRSRREADLAAANGNGEAPPGESQTMRPRRRRRRSPAPRR